MRTIFHIDVNSAYLSWTSVENLKTGNGPDLREIPAIIGGDQKMKKSAIFINVARGAIVDQEALTWALQENKIAAAALDVLDGEPMREDNPLRQIQDSGKLIITPHIAWAPKETRERLLDGVYENIKKIL